MITAWQGVNQRPRMTPQTSTSGRYATIFGRALRLRCPRCGQGKLFRGWFAMHAECSSCGLKYQREPGFFLGSIYVNYGLTALLITAAYFIGFFSGVHPDVLLWSLAAFCLLFPLWFFRYARSLWLAFDQYWDPRGEET
jgi:uncharacterized protein (DUF983 family)